MAYVLGFVVMLLGYTLIYYALTMWFPDLGAIPKGNK